MGKKIVGKKGEKTFLYSRKYRDTKKVWEKRAKQVFQKHPNSACKKCWEKNLRNKGQKRFLYSNGYRDQKMGEKTHETICPETHE